jgi:hypothetical protein
MNSISHARRSQPQRQEQRQDLRGSSAPRIASPRFTADILAGRPLSGCMQRKWSPDGAPCERSLPASDEKTKSTAVDAMPAAADYSSKAAFLRGFDRHARYVVK